MTIEEAIVQAAYERVTAPGYHSSYPPYVGVILVLILITFLLAALYGSFLLVKVMSRRK